jgi:nucleoside 2-deoxyribosyltransferase
MRVYLAGPLFTWGEREQNKAVAAELRSLGHEVFVPQENEQREMTARAIFDADVAGMDWANVCVACMDGPDPAARASSSATCMPSRSRRCCTARTSATPAAKASAAWPT